MTGPLLTVVTPCLDSAATIEATLTSVASAGLTGVVEHVVVDGGSRDGTLDVVRRFPEVRWISEPDRGLSDAMNKGIGLARGAFVGWLNADDFYLPGALERVVARLREEPDAVWLTAPCVIVDGDGGEIRGAVTRYKRALLRHHSLGSLLAQNYIAAPSTFFRRDAALEVGGFDERFRYSMDYDLWLRLARRADPIVLDAPLAAFRMQAGGGSLSMTGFTQQFAEHALNAREHGAGHPVAVLANAVMSRLIVLVYRAMRAMRRARGGQH